MRKELVNEALIALNLKRIYGDINELKSRDVTPGPRGLQGPKGDKGDTGEVGPVGPQGLVGPQGEVGPVGPQGETGETGPQGEVGPVGPQGETGETGPQGEVGPIGETGPQGPRGEKGDRGDKGDTGPAGLPGVKGDIGPVGPQGLPGPQGPRGETGEQGPKGDTGPAGPKGETGPQGVKGDTGPIGPAGPKGDRGDIGPQGPQGLPGKDVDPSTLQAIVVPIVNKVEKDFSKWRENVNKSLASIGGGGSYSILDNRDVRMKKASELRDGDILIWDISTQKFISSNIVDVINKIKLELEVQYDKLISESTVDGINYTYVGEALPGALKSEAKWRIKRVKDDNAGNTEVLWAGDTEAFDKVWNDRETYTYDV